MKPPRYFAHPGERVVDEKGKTVCFVRHKLDRKGKVSTDDFEGWRVPVPRQGDNLDDTPGFRGQTWEHGPQVCIDGVWRP